MKITKAQLRKIIKEELLREANGPYGDVRDEPVASSIYDDHDEYMEEHAYALGSSLSASPPLAREISALLAEQYPKSSEAVMKGFNEGEDRLADQYIDM
jgi:hypothetical protein